MVKIITFEGTDYSGKTATFMYLEKSLSKKKSLAFNEGPIYPNGLSAKLLMVANQSNDKEKEFWYTMLFAYDTLESLVNYPQDKRIFFQDRYWPSVLAYGRFLNKSNSLHNHQNFRNFFLTPLATIHFTCSYDEKIKRSKQRNRKSVIDKVLLENYDEVIRLEEETEKSLKGLPNLLKIDTTNRSIPDVASQIKDYLNFECIPSLKI